MAKVNSSFKSLDLLHLLNVQKPKRKHLASFNDIKKMHHTATHNCSAYMIGEHDDIQKANDDGEPSGTAGVLCSKY